MTTLVRKHSERHATSGSSFTCMNIGAAMVMCVLATGACSHTPSKPAVFPPTSAPVGTTTTPSAAQIAENTQARKDVSITSCAADRLHHVEIKGIAHNPTSSAATYAVQLSIRDASGKHFYATAAATSNVAPKGKAEWDAATTAPYVAGTMCSITSASRRAS
jgi:hypothetical protein